MDGHAQEGRESLDKVGFHSLTRAMGLECRDRLGSWGPGPCPGPQDGDGLVDFESEPAQRAWSGGAARVASAERRENLDGGRHRCMRPLLWPEWGQGSPLRQVEGPIVPRGSRGKEFEEAQETTRDALLDLGRSTSALLLLGVLVLGSRRRGRGSTGRLWHRGDLGPLRGQDDGPGQAAGKASSATIGSAGHRPALDCGEELLEAFLVGPKRRLHPLSQKKDIRSALQCRIFCAQVEKKLSDGGVDQPLPPRSEVD
mmetsp:Transcript_8264/g.23480  ORF Transcript_8264/g.23480 Transcript_8264/m.23480 type:complete len:256 (-) Transcript_8264:724-1491(-)